MTRITLVAALMSAAVVTAATVPFIRPTLVPGSQAPSTHKETQANQEKPRPVEQEIVQFRDLEDAFYQILKRDREFNHPRWPFAIKVRDVQGRTLIDATFTHRTKGKDNEFDAVIQANRAVLRFDLDAKMVRVSLEEVEVQNLVRNQDVILIKGNALEFPIPLDVERGLLKQAGASPEGQIVVMDSDMVLSLVYSSDGKTLATAGFDGVVHLWDMIKAERIIDLKGEKSTIRSVTFAPDGKAVACVNDAGLVRLWDVATGRLKQTFPALSESMRQSARTFMLDSIAFSPDGRLLAVSGFGPIAADMADRVYELSVFDVQTGQPFWSHMGRGEQACALAFAPDGATLARAGWRTVKLWDAKTGEPVRTLTPTSGTIFAVVFTPDGRTLVGGGNILTKDVNQQAGLVTLWNVMTGQIIHTLEGHTGGVHAVAVTPDGKKVASGGDSHGRLHGGSPSEIRLWDIATGKLLWTVEGEQGVVRGLAFAPHGNSLVYSDDNAVGIIDVHTGTIDRTLTKTNRTPRP